MLLLSAPLSREVSLPLTSTTETCPACRMVAEKSQDSLLLWGHPILPAAAGQTKRIVSYNREKDCESADPGLLLSHDYPHAAPPALRKTNAHNLHLRREVAE